VVEEERLPWEESPRLRPRSRLPPLWGIIILFTPPCVAVVRTRKTPEWWESWGSVDGNGMRRWRGV